MGDLVPVSDEGIADWVTALPASEKGKFLTMVAEGDGAQVEALLVQRFRRESRPTGAAAASRHRQGQRPGARETGGSPMPPTRCPGSAPPSASTTSRNAGQPPARR